MMQRLGIDESRCRLHGSLTDVSSEYLKSSIFALPSRFEGFGLVIIEAMACGLPVVSFDCENGPRNILTNGKNGFLVPCFDTDAYARQLVSLMTDDSLLRQVGREAREASAAYSLADVARQWQQLFDKLMTGK
jgi:glycosyltransferase involved in cell wall biosynthesis